MMEHTGDTVTDKFHKVVDPMKTTKNRATRAPSSNVEGILAVSSSLNVFANPALPSVQPPATKPLTSPGLDQFHNNAAKAPMRVNFLAPSFVVPKTPGIENVPIITTQLVAKKSAAPTRPLLLPPSKPFVKLVPTRKPSNQSFKTPTDFQPSPSSTAPHLRYLDFAPSNSEGSFAPKNISLPPRISQRQRTSRLAIILSQLSDSSRRACCLVSKSWRYAGMPNNWRSCYCLLITIRCKFFYLLKLFWSKTIAVFDSILFSYLIEAACLSSIYGRTFDIVKKNHGLGVQHIKRVSFTPFSDFFLFARTSGVVPMMNDRLLLSCGTSCVNICCCSAVLTNECAKISHGSDMAVCQHR